MVKRASGEDLNWETDTENESVIINHLVQNTKTILFMKLQWGRLCSFLQMDAKNCEISHYTICADIVHGLANCLLQTIASSVTGQIDVAFREFSDFTLEEKGKIRYISGWVLKRLWEKGRSYINGNITSENKKVRDQVKSEILQCKILVKFCSAKF